MSRTVPTAVHRTTSGLLSIVVYLKPPTKNDIKPTPRVANGLSIAWLNLKNLEDEWGRAIPEAEGDQRARTARELWFTRVMGSARERPYDTFNLVTGINAVVCDWLVKRGWLLDDRETDAVMHLPQQRYAYQGEIAPSLVIETRDLGSPPLVARAKVD